MKLEKQDLRFLMEAVDSWTDGDFRLSMNRWFLDIFKAIEEKNLEKLTRLIEASDSIRIPAEERRAVRRDRAILMKAKLIQMGDALAVEELTDAQT
jgi:hypothetical protein